MRQYAEYCIFYQGAPTNSDTSPLCSTKRKKTKDCPQQLYTCTVYFTHKYICCLHSSIKPVPCTLFLYQEVEIKGPMLFPFLPPCIFFLQHNGANLRKRGQPHSCISCTIIVFFFFSFFSLY